MQGHCFRRLASTLYGRYGAFGSKMACQRMGLRVGDHMRVLDDIEPKEVMAFLRS